MCSNRADSGKGVGVRGRVSVRAAVRVDGRMDHRDRVDVFEQGGQRVGVVRASALSVRAAVRVGGRGCLVVSRDRADVFEFEQG